MLPIHAWALGVLALPQVGPGPGLDQTRNAVLLAEDRQPLTREGLSPILAGLASPYSLTQKLAVRALGRPERPELAADIAHLLTAASTPVRAEAVNALGQAVTRGGAAGVRRLLEDRLGLETEPVVRGALLRTLGRLPVATPDERTRTERLLIQATHTAGTDAAAPVLEGAVHGLASLCSPMMGSFWRAGSGL